MHVESTSPGLVRLGAGGPPSSRPSRARCLPGSPPALTSTSRAMASCWPGLPATPAPALPSRRRSRASRSTWSGSALTRRLRRSSSPRTPW